MRCQANAGDILRKCRSVADALTAIRTRFGVHASYQMAVGIRGYLATPFIRSTYPPQWVAEYLLGNHMFKDPVVIAGFERTEPFDAQTIKLDAEGAAILRAARSHGAGLSGYCVPVIDRRGKRAVFYISSPLEGAEWKAFLDEHRATLGVLAVRVHDIAMREIGEEPALPSLTQRERDVLQLSAQGLDHRMIADHLGISHHTAKDYMKRAREKLECSSMAQAVARAVAMRIISA